MKFHSVATIRYIFTLCVGAAILACTAVPSADLTGPFWTKRIERHCLGKEVGHGEEEI